MKDSKKIFLRNDILLVAFIALAAVVFAITFRLTAKSGNSVVVLVDGKALMSFDLKSDCEKLISNQYGENLLVIKNGKASIKTADCPDEICVKHREISKTGETIVCLPHKLVIEVE